MQFAAIWLTHVVVRGRWLSHAGAMFAAAACVFHGLTEITQAIWPGSNPYRRLLSQAVIDDWMILVSAAILLYAATYAVVLRLGQRGRTGAEPTDPGAYTRSISLRLLLTAAVPMLIATALGHGDAGVRQANGVVVERSYALGGLTGQFTLILAGVIGAIIIIRYGARWTIPVLAVEGLTLAMSGQRSGVVMVFVLTVYVLSIAGVRLPRRKLATAGLVGLILVLSISAARGAGGRQQFWAGQSASVRSNAIGVGLEALGTAQAWESVRRDTVYRFDGNTFGALVMQQEARHIPAVGVTTIGNNLALSVPSFINTGKKSTSLAERNEEVYLERHFTLGSESDFLPGVLGTLVAYFGPAGLLVLGVLIGLLLGAADVLIRRKPSAPALFVGLGLVLSSLAYEQGPPGFLVTMRGALTIAALAWGAPWIWTRWRSRSPNESRLAVARQRRRLRLAGCR